MEKRCITVVSEMFGERDTREKNFAKRNDP